MDIKGIRNSEIVTSNPSETPDRLAEQTTTPKGISDAPSILETFSPHATPPGVPIPYPNADVLVAFQPGDVRDPFQVGNLWNDSELPPESNSSSGQATKDIARFILTDQDVSVEGLQQYAASGSNGDVLTAMLEYQKFANNEAREDQKLPEASIEYLIGVAQRLMHGDSGKQKELMQKFLDQLKEAQHEIAAKLADGSVKPVTTEQMNHLINFLSHWPPKD